MANALGAWAMDAVEQVMRHGEQWAADYVYSSKTNEYAHREGDAALKGRVTGWYADALG